MTRNILWACSSLTVYSALGPAFWVLMPSALTGGSSAVAWIALGAGFVAGLAAVIRLAGAPRWHALGALSLIGYASLVRPWYETNDIWLREILLPACVMVVAAVVGSIAARTPAAGGRDRA